MKVTIYNAISIDGFIATKADDTSWVNDWEYYEAEIKKNDCIIYGRKTYEDMVKSKTFPIEGLPNIVYTWHPKRFSDIKGAEFRSTHPPKLIQELQEKGYTNILISGGGRTNATFLNDGVVDEVIVDIHPLILGDGIRLFESKEIKVDLEKMSEKALENGITQVRYKVIK